jgi:hypothetical protein
MVRSAQTLHLSCVKISTISNELNQASTSASSPRSTIGCVRNNFWAYGMFSTILHLSWTDTSTISKWTKMRFHTTHVTLEFHRVRPKWFLSLRYVRRKPCNYLASRLALSSNGLNRASTWALSPRSTIVCVSKTTSKAMVRSSTISKWTKIRFHMTHVTLEFHWVRPKQFLSLWYVRRKPCNYIASNLALSPIKLNRASTWALTPRSTIGCVQINLCAYCMFGANRALISHRHQHCLQMD